LQNWLVLGLVASRQSNTGSEPYSRIKGNHDQLSFHRITPPFKKWPTADVIKIFKKIFAKVGVFIGGRKRGAKTPHPPRNSPQIHHDLPPKNTTKSAKSPVKDHIDTP